METKATENNKDEQPESQNETESKIVRLLEERLYIDKLTTNIINLKDIRIPSALNILKLNGSGKITEVAIISQSDFSVFIKADGKELLNKNSDYTTLSELSGILNDIDADTSGANKRVVIRNIRFINSILIQVNSDSEITAENIFCKYDLQKQPTEEKSKKACTTG